MEMKGIDVSKWQGNVDWAKAKAAGLQFAMLRAGLGRSAAQKDPFFDRNYSECKRLGIPVGVYWYSYATNTSAAALEAQACLAVLAGKQFEMPVAFDQEYEAGILALNNAQRTAICKAFLHTMEAAGYYAVFYASTDWIKNRVNYAELAGFDMWPAQYGAKCTCPLPFGMWQHHGGGSKNWPAGSWAGVSGAVDLDTAYKNYPEIIKGAGLNGYTKADAAQPAGSGNNAQQDKQPEAEQEANPAEVTTKTLKIGPMSAGDVVTVKKLAESLGLPVVEA